MSDDLVRLMAVVDGEDPSPEFVSALRKEIDAELLDDHHGAVGTIRFTDRAVEADEQRGDETAGDRLWFDESAPRTQRRRWFGVVTAAAATILVVAGVLVVVTANRDVVNTDPASSPEVFEPEPVPPPSVVDALGYRWHRLPHDDAVVAGDQWWTNSVTLGGPGLVAVGSVGNERDADAAVWTSVDGITWSRVPHDEAVFGGEGAYGMHTVFAGGPGLVGIGGERFGNNDNDVLWTSSDGFSWKKRVSGDVFEGGVANDVIAGGPGFVAVGEYARGAAVWTSVDGLAWSRIPHDQEVFGGVGDGNGMTGVTVGGPGLVAVGSDLLNSDAPTGRAHAVVWTSVDGLTWSRVPHDESVFGGKGDQGMFDVVVGGPGLVAVGENDLGASVWTSVDGITWSRVPDDEAVFNAHTRISNVIATSAGLVAVGDNNDAAVWTSVDGITWARDSAVFGGVDDVTIGGPGLVTVGDWSGGVWVATMES